MAPATSRMALQSLILCFLVFPISFTAYDRLAASRDAHLRASTWSPAPPEAQWRRTAKSHLKEREACRRR